MKYNFVVLAAPGNLYRYMWKEMLELDNVVVFWDKADMLELLPKSERKIADFHISSSINKVIRLPMKKIWYRRAAKRLSFPNDNPVCFVWHWYFMSEIENGLSDYIRKSFPNSRQVYFFMDPWYIDEDKINFLRKKMDIIAVYDPGVAEKYNLLYLPNIYPGMKTNDVVETDYDICFVGGDKGRGSILREISKLCEERSIKTAFYLRSGDCDKYEDGIHYFQNKLAYTDVIDIIRRSRCILELKVEPDCACSLRVQEAVVYNKKMITNNKNVYRMPCCKGNQGIRIFNKIDDIDWDFVKRDEKVDYHYDDEYSAKTWLEQIEKNIEH